MGFGGRCVPLAIQPDETAPCQRSEISEIAAALPSMIFDNGGLAMPGLDLTENADPTPAPVLRPDPLDVDHVLADELARLRPDFKPSRNQPSSPLTKEDVSPARARELFEQNLTALCLSGGGIRSTSFCLGILQALAQRKLLSRFDYLSTVSGGGYIGSWLSAWRSRKGQSIASVEESLSGNREPAEVTSLRDFASYLTPSRGLMSADTWTGFATVIRNLLLNWTLFLPLLLLLVWIPKVAVLVFQWGQSRLPQGGSGALLELGSPAFWVLAVAAIFYFAAEMFASLEMIKAEPQHGILPKEQQGNSDTLTSGAGQGSYVLWGLLPAYFAACLASVVLVRACPAGDDCWASVSQYPSQHACQFTVAGALLWGLPFLLAAVGVPLFKAPTGSPIPTSSRKRWLDYTWLVAARALSGAGFGVVLVLAVALLTYLASQHHDRYVVVFGISGFFLAHLAGGILFSGLSTLVPDFDAVREWTARAGGWFLVTGSFYPDRARYKTREA
jgi:hypothetical protein